MKNDEILTPIILAGGSGVRLWPLSRRDLPKQFHILNGAETMFQQTLTRLKSLHTTRPIIICNEEHKFIVEDQITQIKIDCEILLEPISKNTAPAIALAVLSLKPETMILVLAADHIIKDQKTFAKQVEESYQHAKNNKIVIFGIKPQSPNINYGYIETKKFNNNVYEVKEFKEKPDIILAKRYLEDGNYFWNSGMFSFKASTFIEELGTHEPKILKICKKAIKTLKKKSIFNSYDKVIFSKCPNKSIDHAIMEKTKKALMIPLKSDWSDIGTWNSLMEFNSKGNNNVTKGNIVTKDSKKSIIYSLNDRLVAVNGIERMIVIDTKDCLLVSSQDKSENLKKLVAKIKEKKPEIVDSFPDENRPWGSFETLTKDEHYKVKN